MIAHPSDAEYILLDMDGTLIDSSPGIVNALRYALGHMGIDEGDDGKLVTFIGPPLYESFRRAYGFDRAASAEATRFFQVYYEKRGWLENALYPGIPELLSRWHREGRRLIMATSKPESFAVRIARRFGIDTMFRLIAGGDEEERNVEKEHIIESARRRLALPRFDSAVMIGDRKHDVVGAQRHHIPAVGVLYGFGSEQELIDAGARWIARDLPGLAALWA